VVVGDLLLPFFLYRSLFSGLCQNENRIGSTPDSNMMIRKSLTQFLKKGSHMLIQILEKTIFERAISRQNKPLGIHYKHAARSAHKNHKNSCHLSHDSQ
jgi:hypothetical protein